MLAISSCLRRAHLVGRNAGRLYSAISEAQEANLDGWIKQICGTTLHYGDEVSRSRVRDLYYTLPTRDPLDVPSRDAHLPPMHCLAFFHPRKTEDQLGADLTENDFCPPKPFGARRMWVGGRFQFPNGSDRSLRIGNEAVARVTVERVEKKGFGKDLPTVFVHKDIRYMQKPENVPIITEKRVHAYLSEEMRPSGKIRDVFGLPNPQFTYTWTPTATTLFRFSALMWNAHLIHLDREYTRVKEGYPDLLVHGPLSALMLVEALFYNGYRGLIDNFEYRAHSPVYVDRRQHIRGMIDESREKAIIWIEDDDGVIGMTGTVDLLLS